MNENRFATAFKNLPTMVYLIAIYGFIFLPSLVLFLFSFQDSTLPVPPFNGPSLRWYKAILVDGRIMESLLNSILVATISSAIATILGFLAAYGLARFRVWGAGFIQWILMVPISMSYLVIGMGLLITFNSLGIPKSLFSIIVGHVVINLPLAFAILYSQMGSHQANVERAARDLGAGDWQVILLISIPMLLPALLAAFFLSFTLSWDEFIIALMVSRFEVTLPVEIWGLLRSGLNPRTNAVGSLVFLVSIVFVLLIEFQILKRKKFK